MLSFVVNRTKADLIKDRPNKVSDIRSHIERVKAEKAEYQRQLTIIRTELNRLQDDYKNQASISTDRWGTIAADAGINDTIKLVNCVRDSAHIARIREDAATGNRLNIRGTPTVFVNDVRIDGGVSYELLDSLTQAKLPKKMAGRQ